MADIRARQRLTIRQGAVGACAVEVTTTQHLGEQAHLTTCTTTFALDAGSRQCSFTGDQGNEVITKSIDLVGNRLEELGTAHGRQVAIGRISGSGSLGGSVDFFRRSLDKGVRQRFTAAGVEALVLDGAGGAALTADIIVASQTQHGVLLSVHGGQGAIGTMNEARRQGRDAQSTAQL